MHVRVCVRTCVYMDIRVRRTGSSRWLCVVSSFSSLSFPPLFLLERRNPKPGESELTVTVGARLEGPRVF